MGTGLVTKFLIFACIGFAVLGSLADARNGGAELFRFLAFSDFALNEPPLAAIGRGEIWRLFTPMFIYAGLPGFGAVLHLVFDMWWLRTLAAPFEHVNRGRFLALFVATTAIVTGLAQVLFGQSLYHGMAGIVAALFAYVYVRGRTDPTSPLALPPGLGFWMLLWTVLALAQGNMVPLRIAGFAFGGLAGYLHGLLRSRR
ncbi:MAG: rhomboid family intramembrane serine protease [Polyangiaceae bacterium]|nr:rhomboid family intramembrane serine protease [Polyangiaceae bacterium]